MDEIASDAFDNAQLPSGTLPDYRAVAFEGVSERLRPYALVSTLLNSLLLLLVPVALHFFGDAPGSLPTVLAIALVGFAPLVAIHRWVDAGFRGWALREHDLIARQGVLWRAVTVLPIARIQHVETSSGPLERAFGLARLRLYTAGGVTADLVVIGLPAGTADRLREHLVEEIRRRDAAGDGPEDSAHGPD